MPTYLYRCPQHGPQEIVKPMREAARPEVCPDCATRLARIFTAVAVQNYSKTVGGLVSWGQDERPVKVHKDAWLAEERYNRLEYGPQED